VAAADSTPTFKQSALDAIFRAMDDAETMTPGQIANHTFAYLRRIEKQLENVTEVLLRHETRLGRIERDVGEVKSDIVLLENQLLSRMNEILGIVRKVDEQEARLSSLETPAQ
jgi:hypothetical protein